MEKIKNEILPEELLSHGFEMHNYESFSYHLKTKSEDYGLLFVNLSKRSVTLRKSRSIIMKLDEFNFDNLNMLHYNFTCNFFVQQSSEVKELSNSILIAYGFSAVDENYHLPINIETDDTPEIYTHALSYNIEAQEMYLLTFKNGEFVSKDLMGIAVLLRELKLLYKTLTGEELLHLAARNNRKEDNTNTNQNDLITREYLMSLGFENWFSDMHLYFQFENYVCTLKYSFETNELETHKASTVGFKEIKYTEKVLTKQEMDNAIIKAFKK